MSDENAREYIDYIKTDMEAVEQNGLTVSTGATDTRSRYKAMLANLTRLETELGAGHETEFAAIRADLKTMDSNASSASLGSSRFRAANKAAETKLDLLTSHIPEAATPWSPDLFPDEVLFAYQVGKMSGDIITYRPPGLLGEASKPHTILSRTPTVTDEGLVFNKNQFLLRKGTSFGSTMYRGFLIRFKVDSPTGQVHLMTMNINSQGKGNSPRIFVKNGQLVARWDAMTYDGTTAGPVQQELVISDGVVCDGTTWNSAVIGRHENYLFNRLNGVLTLGPDRPWNGDNNMIGDSIIGPRADQGDTMGVVIGDFIALQGELSEDWYKKADDWMQGKKPAYSLETDHPPIRKLDLVAHNQWVADNPRNASKFKAHAGEPALPLTGYTPVYLEDFRLNTLGAGGKVNEGFSPTVYAQGANPAVGGDEGTKNPFLDDAGTPTYQWEPGKLHIGCEYRDGKWRAGALTSVSNSMHGRSWKDGYVFTVRSTYPSDISGKLFYGEWGYLLGFRHHHHILRGEIDFNEPDAPSRFWGNWFSVHNHKPFIGTASGIPHHKIIGQSITKANGYPVDLDHFSGQPITREVRVDPDFIYLNIDLTSPEDLNDRTNMKEWLRFPTPPGFLERWYFMINTCIKNDGTWQPDPAKKYPLTVHKIRIMQRDSVVNQLPAEFNSRPALSVSDGQATVTVSLKSALNCVEYVWSAKDGYQLGVTTEPTFPSTDVKKVLVRLIGANGQPEAWSNTIA